MKYILLLALFLFNPSAHAKEKQESFFDGTKTIHLKFTDVIDDKYTVNVLWTPDDGYVPRLVGPATIRFVKDSGLAFSVSADAFHLPFDVLNKLGLLKFDDSGDYHTLAVDLTKVYPVEYNTTGKDSLFDSFHGNNVPFFFEDIDFDGKDELIIVDFGTGQRRVDEYTVYKSGEIPNRKITYRPVYQDSSIYNLATTEPFNMLDQKTTFDKKNRTIDVFLSGGACGSASEKFKLLGGKYKPIEFTEWTPTEGACAEIVYGIREGKRVLKSITESYWDSESNENVKLGTKYY
jgi:hypothetical protein